MKTSRYNLYLQDSTGMVIYNAKSDEIVALTPELADIFEEKKCDYQGLQTLHPELCSYLVQKGIFVDEGINEVTEYIRAIKQADTEDDSYTITVNPTLACNMKCWYCYENHRNMPMMPTKVKESILALSQKLCTSGKIRRIQLSFFGGEPLLGFGNIVIGIMTALSQVCSDNNVSLSVHFTTNAYLLTEDMLEQMQSFDVSFQITLDGNENLHNTIRYTQKGEPTYATIVKNIKLALSKGFSVGVRFNYTHQTLPVFIDTLSDFRSLSLEQKKLLNFNFQRVWQDKNGDAEMLEKNLGEMEKAFEAEGLSVVSANDFFVPYCYADKANTAVVNFNGDLYKCTARDFTVKNREGVLSAQGELIWNEKHKERMSIRFGNTICQRCRIYPICHGGCSQMKLETKYTDCCPKGYNDKQITQIMKSRALFILDKYKKALSK